MVTKVNAVTGMNVDSVAGDIVLVLQGESPQPYAIQIARSCVSALVAALVGQVKRSREKFGDNPDAQYLTLTGVRQTRDPFGYSHLELMLDNALPFPLALDKKSAEGLQTALSKLQESGKLRDSPLAH